MTRIARLLLVLAVTLMGVSGGTVVVGAQQPGTDPRFYPETGFRIDNDAFWDYFRTRGGIPTFGYPVSREFTLLGFPVQIFQRIVVQQKPDGSVSTLNLLDEGLLPYTRINGSTFPAPDRGITEQTPSPNGPNYGTRMLEFVTEHAPDVYIGERVNFGQTFRRSVTFEDAFPDGNGSAALVPLFNLEIWGAPTSRPTLDPNNIDFIYLRFQRGIMHYDSATGVTQGLLLADYLKSVMTGTNLPDDLAQQARGSRFYLQYDPSRPNSLARPGELPATDLTDAFVLQLPVVGAPTPTVVAPTVAPTAVPVEPAPTVAATATPEVSPTATPVAPAATPVPAPLTPSGQPLAYGFNVYLEGLDQPSRAAVLARVGEAGFGWIAHEVAWSSIETAPGQFTFQGLDAIVEAAQRSGVKVLLTVVDAPVFHRAPGSGRMPADSFPYQRVMFALANRYGGEVHAYQMWPRPNVEAEAGTDTLNPARYLELLKAGYIGVKSANPAAQVLLGPPQPAGLAVAPGVVDDVQFLENLYAVNGGEVARYFDILAAHVSGYAIPPDCTPATPECSLSGTFNGHPSFFAFSRVAQYREVMVRHGDAGKPIWLTAFGYAATNSPVPGQEYAAAVSEAQQAQMLARAFEVAGSLGYVGGVMVENLNYQQVGLPTDPRWAFGVLRSDGSPRPAYTALSGMPKPTPLD